ENQQWRFDPADLDNLKTDIVLAEDNPDEQIKFIYPNPFTDKLNLAVSDELSFDQYWVQDMHGKILRNSQSIVDNENLEIDLQSLNPGIYIISLKGANHSRSFKIIKEK
ncbi:MAG: T9SS type A sorting domain-containing protein, partial [Marinoscillum sp.]